ncbi:MAG: hypothetical protein ACJAUQ_001572 [Maribacter sp.]|jgi:hypothetical protein
MGYAWGGLKPFTGNLTLFKLFLKTINEIC